MVESRVKNIIERVNKLPTLPTVANKITKLIKDPTCTAIRVSEVIDKDQSLTSRVLRLVNSAFYSLCTEVTNVRHAVALLGFKTISQMVISISVFDVFKGGNGKEFNREGFWKHSIGCAVISQSIAESIHYPRIDDCFTSGLMHDIGKVVLDQYLHEELVKVLELTQEKGIYFADAEKEVMGIDHTDVGSQVMKNWNIPLLIIAAVTHHHQPMKERKGSTLSQDIIVDIVRVADVICRRGHIGYTGDSVIPELTKDLWERLNLEPSSLVRIAESCGEEIERAGVLLELTS
jgi:putative nucleotidyltransferase with HDIG domain